MSQSAEDDAAINRVRNYALTLNLKASMADAVGMHERAAVLRSVAHGIDAALEGSAIPPETGAS